MLSVDYILPFFSFNFPFLFFLQLLKNFLLFVLFLLSFHFVWHNQNKLCLKWMTEGKISDNDNCLENLIKRIIVVLIIIPPVAYPHANIENLNRKSDLINVIQSFLLKLTNYNYNISETYNTWCSDSISTFIYSSTYNRIKFNCVTKLIN